MHKKILTAVPVIIAIMLFSAFYYLTLHHSRIPPQALNEKEQSPDSFMTQVSYKRYNKLGQLHMRLSATKALQYQKKDKLVFLKPNLVVQTANQIPWHISAKLASSADHFKKLNFKQNVLIYQPEQPQHPETKIKTSTISIFPRQSLALTQAPVTITRPHTQLSGVGMQVNLKDSTIRLLSQSSGSYHDK